MLNQLTFRKRTYTEKGSPIKTIYGSTIDKNGNIIVKEKGKEDLYAYIQSFADSVDINVTLAKFANGDTTALNKKEGLFIDTTEFPKTYAEALNIINDSRNYFDTLSADVRSKFDNDINKFIATIGTNEWIEKMKGIKNGLPDNNTNVDTDNSVHNDTDVKEEVK